MKYISNEEYIKDEMEKFHYMGSELVDAMLNYEGAFPDRLSIFDEHCYCGLNFIPNEVRYLIMNNTKGEFIIVHKYEYWALPGESYDDFGNRLIKEFLDKTGLPVFIEED